MVIFQFAMLNYQRVRPFHCNFQGGKPRFARPSLPLRERWQPGFVAVAAKGFGGGVYRSRDVGIVHDGEGGALGPWAGLMEVFLVVL
jgi:hypothetical protein